MFSTICSHIDASDTDFFAYIPITLYTQRISFVVVVYRLVAL